MLNDVKDLFLHRPAQNNSLWSKAQCCNGRASVLSDTKKTGGNRKQTSNVSDWSTELCNAFDSPMISGAAWNLCWCYELVNGFVARESEGDYIQVCHTEVK